MLEKLYKLPPYSLPKTEKQQYMYEGLMDLTRRHQQGCSAYAAILHAIGWEAEKATHIEDIPMIPVRLFKQYELLSVPKEEIIKTMTSSGTSGQAVSRIFLDRQNVRDQTKTLYEIIMSYLGHQRLPLLMLDTALALKDRSMFSARGAGIVGFSTFGRNTVYALDENMQLDIEKIRQFLEKHDDETILMFGYTYMIWQYVIRALEDAGISLPLKRGILFHIGGWKKLKDQAVDTLTYNQRLNACLGGHIEIHNYYGMAEQLGSVFVECEHGHMHCSNYSDVLIRNPADLSSCGVGQRGLIQLVSLLPTSYPGHSLLTEDEGEIQGEDDCPCGRKGKYFKIYGRIKGAELRGCSDTYEKK